MTDGVVIDANIISRFYLQLLTENGRLFRMVSCLSASYGLAVSDRILCEWENACSAQVMIEWITDGLKEGWIRYVIPVLAANIMKEIYLTYGLPRKSRDMEYIKCANVTVVKYIVSEDMDFYDPRLKRANGKAKQRARDLRKGRLCRFLRRALGIRAGTPAHCCCDFGIG